MKNNNIKKFFLIGAILVCIIVAVVLLKLKKNGINIDNRILSNAEEIKEKLDINISNIVSDADPEYDLVEGDAVDIIYQKGEMKYILKVTKNSKKRNIELNDRWGTSILMDSKCDDGTVVSVYAFLSTDNMNTMKAEWFDEGIFFVMYTENLTSREEFLQEVNKIIIDNHVKTD